MEKKYNKTPIKFSWCLALVFIFALFSGAKAASAASLSLSPASGSFQVGQTFSVRVTVDSPNAAINAVSGVVSFPQDKLKITSLSKTGAIVSLWVQEPSFSNEVGTMNFEGIVLNPGFQGDAGRIITVNFQVKAAGAANIAFASGSILANDGLGTNVLGGFTNANFGLKPAPQGEEAGQSTTPSEINPLAPKITSPTHPDPNKWYNDKNPKFTWTVPPGVTEARLLYDKFPQSVPAVIYSPPILEKVLENIPDGVWYFHVQLRDANGWGSVANFRFQIDTTPPEKFSIKFVDTSDTTNPQPTALFNTTDGGSGIDRYRVKIGDRDFVAVSADAVKSNPYTLPPTEPGKQIILVQAFDKAGNYETALSEFNILSLPAPIITDYPSIIRPDDVFAVKGTTQPLAKVVIWFERDGATKNFTGSSDSTGLFTIAGNGSSLNGGNYRIWAEATDARGARTLPSERHDVAVESPYLIRIGSYAINILTVVVSIVSLVALLGFMLWHFWKKFAGARRRIRKESQEASRNIHKEFVWLKEKLHRHVKSLEQAQTKRELTLEEKKILFDIKSEIDRVEEIVEKNLEEIKKDLD